MKKISQADWVKQQLKETGRITRNQCLNRFPAITRLSAIIQLLEVEGYQFNSKKEENDWTYELIDSPKRRVYVFDLVDGIRKPRAIFVPV